MKIQEILVYSGEDTCIRIEILVQRTHRDHKSKRYQNPPRRKSHCKQIFSQNLNCTNCLPKSKSNCLWVLAVGNTIYCDTMVSQFRFKLEKFALLLFQRNRRKKCKMIITQWHSISHFGTSTWLPIMCLPSLTKNILFSRFNRWGIWEWKAHNHNQVILGWNESN